jgi:hypothetical protein
MNAIRTGNGFEAAAAESLVNDLQKYPQAFVLACLMDVHILAERAWLIPNKIRELLGGDFSIEALCSKDLDWYTNAFRENSLHRYNDRMAEVFYRAVHLIQDQYGGDASRIWSGNPERKEVVARFKEFKGCGAKVSEMAADLLQEIFSVPFAKTVAQ